MTNPTNKAPSFLDPLTSATFEDIVNELRRRYDTVVIGCVKQDDDNDRAELTWTRRGGYYPAMGILQEMERLFRKDQDEKTEVTEVYKDDDDEEEPS